MTNIGFSNRKDYQGTSIRASVIWVAEYSKDNLEYFRYLSIRILNSFINQDNFLKEISDAVESGGENGFTVKSFDVLKPPKPKDKFKLTNQVLPGGLLKIEDDNFQELIQNLIQDLESFELPEKDGPLVVVTGIQTKSTLEKAKVWRALSKQIESNDEGSLKENTNFFSKQPKSNQGANSMATTVTEAKKASFSILTIVLSFCLIISVIGNIWLWNQVNENKDLDNNIKNKREQLKTLNHDYKVVNEDLVFYQQQKEKLESYFKDFQKVQNNVRQVFEDIEAHKLSKSESHS